ncbi:MAG: hypothetical protein ABWX94_02715 [Candidatus Saccharimonadales bacterium]
MNENRLPPLNPTFVPSTANAGHRFGWLEDGGVTSPLMYPTPPTGLESYTSNRDKEWAPPDVALGESDTTNAATSTQVASRLSGIAMSAAVVPHLGEASPPSLAAGDIAEQEPSDYFRRLAAGEVTVQKADQTAAVEASKAATQATDTVEEDNVGDTGWTQRAYAPRRPWPTATAHEVKEDDSEPYTGSENVTGVIGLTGVQQNPEDFDPSQHGVARTPQGRTYRDADRTYLGKR